MLRIYLPLSLTAGFDCADSYPVIAWLCWVPNLLVAQHVGKPTSDRSTAVQPRPEDGRLAIQSP